MNFSNVLYQFKKGLSKSREELVNKLDFIFNHSQNKSDFLERLEELLILSDLGTSATLEIISKFNKIDLKEYKENDFIFLKKN